MSNLKAIAAILLSAFILSSCNKEVEKKDKCVLHGTIKGMTKGQIIFSHLFKRDTIQVENEKFVYENSFSEPVAIWVNIVKKKKKKVNAGGAFDLSSIFPGMSGGDDNKVQIFAENAEMTFTAHKDSLKSAKVTGSAFQKEYEKYNKGIEAINAKHNKNKAKKDIKNEQKFAGMGFMIQNDARKEINEYWRNYPKNNPKSPYSAYLLEQRIQGDNAKDIEKKLALLDPSLDKTPQVIRMRKMIEKMKETEVSFESFLKDAKNVDYKVDKDFNGADIKNVIYLSVIDGNKVCALSNKGVVKIIDPNGKLIFEFQADVKGKLGSIAVDKSNNIFVLASQMKVVQKKFRGKLINQQVPDGVLCAVYSQKGKKLKEFKLANNVTASGARIVEDKLIVSDCNKALVSIYDAENGELKSQIEKMRPCCGMLDFSVRDNKEILVANLGAFRVQSYDLNGNTKIAFGRRGKSINDFHGCCNPVGVAYLASGSIVTVEKEPTRVKIYSKEGAKEIQGIDELVKGCNYIPMIVDSNDNLYLASMAKGIIKCTSIQ